MHHHLSLQLLSSVKCLTSFLCLCRHDGDMSSTVCGQDCRIVCKNRTKSLAGLWREWPPGGFDIMYLTYSVLGQTNSWGLCKLTFRANMQRSPHRPLESTLHLPLLLVGLYDLWCHSGQEVLKVWQEMRLVPAQLGPQAAHLGWTDGTEWKSRCNNDSFCLCYHFS